MPGSGLDAFQPQVIFLATSARDVARFPSVDQDEDAVARLATTRLPTGCESGKACNAKWNATIMQNNFEIAPVSILGHLQLATSRGSRALPRAAQSSVRRAGSGLSSCCTTCADSPRRRELANGSIRASISNSRCLAEPSALSLMPTASYPCCGPWSAVARRFWCWTWTILCGAAVVGDLGAGGVDLAKAQERARRF